MCRIFGCRLQIQPQGNRRRGPEIQRQRGNLWAGLALVLSERSLREGVAAMDWSVPLPWLEIIRGVHLIGRNWTWKRLCVRAGARSHRRAAKVDCAAGAAATDAWW